MHAYTLFYSPDSANLIVRIVLEEVAAAYSAELVDRSVKAQRSPEYLRLNPQGLIPVLVHDGFAIFETAAIVLYLADRHAGLSPARDANERGAFYSWLLFLSNTLHADLRVLFYAHRHVEKSCIASLRAGSVRRVLAHLELIDQHMADHQARWMLGREFSACDIYLGVCCRWLLTYPADSAVDPSAIRRLPHLWSLLEALERRPSVIHACEKEWIEPPFFTQPSMPTPPAGSVLG